MKTTPVRLYKMQLFQLEEIQRLSPTCIRIMGGNPGKFTLQGTNTYLLGTGASRLLIDSGEGMGSWIDALERVLHAEKAKVSSLLITHWHRDHQGGIQDLLNISPGTKIYKNEPASGQSKIDDGQSFQVEGATLRAVYTPGHTNDHMVFVLEEEDALFTGDNVLGQGTAVFEDLKRYLDSLSTMKKLFNGRAYPGHGPVVDDGPAKIAEYIHHRQIRENQVVQTLNTRNPLAPPADDYLWTVMQLVKVIYVDVPENLHDAAAKGVSQILRKLEDEDKVVEDGGAWKLTHRLSRRRL